MKVVLGVPWYFPEPAGGTEVYVAGLSTELVKIGIDCVVAVPGGKPQTTWSTFRNVKVARFAGPPLERRPRDGILWSLPADQFSEWLASEKPDIYHQHDWSTNFGLHHLRAAKTLGIPTVISIHLPKLICRTTTMMYKNSSQCDGEIIDERCTYCFLVSRGLPSSAAHVVTKVPASIANGMSKLPGIGSLFSGRGAIRDIASGLRSVAEAADRIVTVSRWLKVALLSNGLPESKVVHIRSGVDPMIASSVIVEERSKVTKLRIGFLGRAHPIKGLHILVESLLRLPKTVDFSLQALVLAQDGDTSYLEKIRKQISGQLAFEILVNEPRSTVNEFFRKIDVLAVPSQWLENAPLVVLEANAWKVPVIGSNLGGIAEMVRHEFDGLLVSHSDVGEWARAFARIVEAPSLIATLKNNISNVHTMEETARDMLKMYRSIT